MLRSTDTFPNYFMEPKVFTDSDESDQETITTKIDISDRNRQNSEIFNDDEDKYSSSTSVKSSMRSKSSKKPCIINSISSEELNNLHFVHYVTAQNTSQSVSIKYDCPIPVIKKINKFHSILNSGDVRIRKVLLIPLKHCGERLRTMRIYDAPETVIPVSASYNDDVETLLKGALAQGDDESDEQYNEVCDKSGSILHRMVNDAIKSEYEVQSDEFEIKLKGFCYFNNEVRSLVVNIPKSIFITRTKRT